MLQLQLFLLRLEYHKTVFLNQFYILCIRQTYSPWPTSLCTATFADDTVILAADKNPEVASSVIQEYLDKIIK